VVLTHGHPDHLGSAEHLRSTYGVSVLAHEAEVSNASGTRVEQVSELTLLGQAWRPAVLRWAIEVMRLGVTRVERVRELRDFGEETLDVPGRPVAIHTPGHTSGHCSLHLPDRGVLLAAFFNTDTGLARRSLSAYDRSPPMSSSRPRPRLPRHACAGRRARARAQLTAPERAPGTAVTHRDCFIEGCPPRGERRVSHHRKRLPTSTPPIAWCRHRVPPALVSGPPAGPGATTARDLAA